MDLSLYQPYVTILGGIISLPFLLYAVYQSMWLLYQITLLAFQIIVLLAIIKLVFDYANIEAINNILSTMTIQAYIDRIKSECIKLMNMIYQRTRRISPE